MSSIGKATRSILVVDDSRVVRMMLRKLLPTIGFDMVSEAENGVEAIRLTGELKPDLVLLDVNMPVMGGIEALPDILRASPGVAVIMLTSSDGKGKIDEAMSKGAFGYVVKLSSPKEIVNNIEKLWTTRV